MTTSTPQVARLADALGLEAAEAAAIVRWLVRNAGEWGPWADERDLAVMLRPRFGSHLGEVTDAQLAGALQQARLIERKVAESDGSFHAQFEPSEWLIRALSAESDRKVAERDRKRARAAESAGKVSGEQRESDRKATGKQQESGGEQAESASRVGSLLPPLSSPRGVVAPSISPADGSPGSATTAERVTFILELAALHGYGRNKVSPAFREELLQHLDAEPEHGARDIEAAFRESDGMGNRKRYLEAVLRSRVEGRERDARPPPGPAGELDEPSSGELDEPSTAGEDERLTRTADGVVDLGFERERRQWEKGVE